MAEMQLSNKKQHHDLLIVTPTKHDRQVIDALGDEISRTPQFTDDMSFVVAEKYRLLFSDVLRQNIEKQAANGLDNGYLLIRELTLESESALNCRAYVAQTLMIAFGHVFGEAYGYEGQRGGKRVQDLRPKREHAQRQLGTGSEVDLLWHTEDAHTFYNADVIGLCCVQGDENAKTLLSYIDVSSLEKNCFDLLSKPYYRIYSDSSHQESGMQVPPVPVIRHCGDYCQIHYDPLYTECLFAEARHALESLTQLINTHYLSIALEQGDILFINNRHAVHARTAYKPSYSAHDRWLKRITFLSKYVPECYLVPGMRNVIKNH